jgi:hypothetical protein
MTTTLSADITKNPIQSGSKISDHINLNPLVFQIEGIISESPIGDIEDEIQTLAGGLLGGLAGTVGANSGLGFAGAGLTAAGGFLGNAVGGELANFVGKRDLKGRSPRIMMKSLISLMKNRQPFIIRTFFHTDEKQSIYQNMVVTSLSFPQSTENGNSLKFNMTAEQIEIVELKVGTADPKYIKGIQAGSSAEPTADLGQQGTETPKPETEKKVDDRSEAYRSLVDGEL